jgi:cyclophilin family peptidyl-prolyl cis-trans isomerase
MSPDRKKGREAAHRRAAARAAAAEAIRRRKKVRVTIIGVVAIAVIAALVFANFPTDDDSSPAASDTFGSSTTLEPSTTTTTTVSAGPFEYGTGECPPADKPAEAPATFSAAPRDCLEPGVDYGAEVVTSEGSFTIDLLEAEAPGTVNNFVVLGRYGWFDGLTFHRVVTDFVNQTGDPTGKGSGGPGYEIADELPGSVADYVPGTVAMANSGPNTNGSQWFTCIDCSVLPTAGYSIFGQVTAGMDVVQAINGLSDGDGPPTKTITITSLTITEQ